MTICNFPHCECGKSSKPKLVDCPKSSEEYDRVFKMQNDQLTRNERIRLEALNQANASAVMKNTDPDEIVDVARKYEYFIRSADDDHPTS